MQAVHASEIAERAETLTISPSRGANCSFTMSPEPAPLSRRTAFGPPFGHPNSLKIALARAVCAKVRARAPLNAKKRTCGGPKVPKSATMDPKWTQNGSKWEPKMCQKSKLCKKVPNVVWTHYLLYILTTGTLQNLTFSHLEATKMQVFST